MHTNPTNPDSERKTGFYHRAVLGFLDGHYIDRDACDASFLRMHHRDSIGDRLHLLFACFGLISLFGPVTLTEIAFAPLGVFFVVRVFNTFGVWIHGFGQPVVLAAIALSAWMMLSLNWSGDPALGWGEISELRWFVLVGLIFPVIEKRTILIAAMCIGLAIGELAQILDGFGIEPIAGLVEDHPGRIAGWWQPVVGGSLLVGGLGLHLPAALLGSGRTRILGIIGSGTISIGIIATGTRGAWIVSALLIVVAVLFAAANRRIRWKHIVILGAFGAIIAIIAGLVMRDSLQTRLDETRTEFGEILDGQYDSYTGLRVQMGKVAIDAGLAHPLIGVGAGGYQHWAIEQDPDSLVHAHAHNSILQIWSTLGIVGLLLWIVIITIMVRASWRIWDRDIHSVYDLGPALGIIGLLLSSITNSIELNTQSAAMLGALAALCPSDRPGHPRWCPDQSSPGDNRPIGEYTGVPDKG